MKRLLLLAVITAVFFACSGKNEPVIIDFTYERIAPLMYRFTNTSTGCDSYKWDFGNGMWSEGTDALCVYETTGTYTVTLKASVAGVIHERRQTIEVTQPDIFIAGYVLYHIPYENRYYKLVFKDDALLPSSWDFKTKYTSLLTADDLPYSYVFTNPRMMENITSHEYYTVEVIRTTNASTSDNDVQCMKQKLKVADILSSYLPEYVLQTESGAAAVGVLMEYDY